MHGWGSILFVGGHILYYHILTNGFTLLFEKNKELKKMSIRWLLLAGSMALLYLAWLLSKGLQNYSKELNFVRTLYLLTLCLFLLQSTTLFYYIFRRHKSCKTWVENFLEWVARKVPFNFSPYIERALNWIGVNELHWPSEKRNFFLFNIVSIIGLVIYVCGIIDISIARYISPLPFVILALTLILGVLNMIIAISRKIHFNLFWLLPLIVFISSHFKYYDVRTIKVDNNNLKRDCVDVFVQKWYQSRLENSIFRDNDSSKVALLILNDGGGSRSATWSTLLMSKFEDITKGEFHKHILAMSGASGGSVGNTSFYGLLRERMKSNGSSFNCYNAAVGFYQNDFLSNVLTRMFGTDLMSYIVPLPTDRAIALEQSLEHDRNANSVLADFFSKPIGSVLDTTGKLPALILNVSNVETGTTGVISNVRFKSQHMRELFDELHADTTIKVSTAAILSARFPFISPAGYLNNKNYVDGGYCDNTGAYSMLQFIKDYRASEVYKNQKLKLKIVHIVNNSIKEVETKNNICNDKYPNGKNTNKKKKKEESNQLSKLVNDLFSPVLMLVSLQSGSTNNNVETLMETGIDPNDIWEFNLYESEDDEPYPVSWVNSMYQFNRISKRVNEVAERDSVRFLEFLRR
jgi:hypothetical protein